MRTLATHTNYAPPSSQDATFEWIAEYFPKARKGVLRTAVQNSATVAAG
jgi:hypothetical protein